MRDGRGPKAPTEPVFYLSVKLNQTLAIECMGSLVTGVPWLD